ncbi:MAG: hypothetical protein HYT42_02235 [Candidatus Sungbacteria bacterium]|nr:hypothetical protein [Candidatus Sungbacteria bacterium]
MDASSKRLQKAIMALAAFGLAALLAVVLWGVAVVSKKSPSPSFLLSSLLSSFNLERMMLEARRATVKSGEKIEFSWVHEGSRRDGIYRFSYKCREGLIITLESGDSAPCGRRLTLENTGRFALTPVWRGKDALPVEIALDFSPAGQEPKALAASTVVTVNPEEDKKDSDAMVKMPPVNASRPVQSAVRPARETARVLANGVPDLAVRIVDTGIIRDGTDEFVRATSTPRGAQGGVGFDVENAGTAVSQKWRFSVLLPILYDNVFNSDIQEPLSPGEKVRFTIGCRNPRFGGDGALVVTVDPRNEIRDANRDNSSARTVIVSEF